MPLPLQEKHKWAVILAGGDGTRLQELTQRISGDSRPKQFCHFFGGKSLLTQTRERIAPLFEEDRSLFLLARAHEAFYEEQLEGVHNCRKVVQPGNRGTAVAMALCLQAIAKQDEDAMVAFFPSDHHYLNCDAFHQSVQCGLRMIEEHPDSVLIMGAEARYPEVEYGWIEPGRTLVDSLVNPLQRVVRFWEKPARPQAELLRQQGCLWNTFVTMGLAGTFLELFHETLPQETQMLEGCGSYRHLEKIYEDVAAADFSKAVLTRIPKRLVVLRDSESGWTDLGSPRRVVDVMSRDGERPSWLPSREMGAFNFAAV